METFNVFLTTSEGESAPARLVIDLDSLTVIIRDDPVAGWDLSQVVAARTGPETIAVTAADEKFTVATTRAEQLARLLPPPPPPEPPPPPSRRFRTGRHRGPGPMQEALKGVSEDMRRPPPTLAVWWLAAGMVAAIVATIWWILSA